MKRKRKLGFEVKKERRKKNGKWCKIFHLFSHELHLLPSSFSDEPHSLQWRHIAYLWFHQWTGNMPASKTSLEPNCHIQPKIPPETPIPCLWRTMTCPIHLHLPPHLCDLDHLKWSSWLTMEAHKVRGSPHKWMDRWMSRTGWLLELVLTGGYAIGSNGSMRL